MLELLATKHDDWVRIAFSMTENIDDAQDLVQDMYLRLDRLGVTKKQITYKDTVNRYFIWTILFNMFKTSKRVVNKQSVRYWKDMKKDYPEKFHTMADKERRDTDERGEPVTFLKDTKPPYEGASLFLIPNENYPEIRDISMVRIRKGKGFIPTYPITDSMYDIAHKEYDGDEQPAFDSIMAKIKIITSDWKPYDKKLFDLYFMQGLSLRKIAKGAGIGLTSIHNSIKGYVLILREELSEDLMDYFNGDYDKID